MMKLTGLPNGAIAIRVMTNGYQGVVLAERYDRHQPYVTWRFHTERLGFFWGHYFSDYNEASRDADRRYKDLMYQQ